MMEISVALRKIEKLENVSEKAKKQMKALVEFCEIMGGEVKRVSSPEEIFEGYEFATVSCHLSRPVTASHIRRLSSGVGVVTPKQWYTLHFSRDTPPDAFVVYEDLKTKHGKLTYYYLAEEGTDEIKGKIPITGFSASVERKGNYINMAFEAV